MRKKAAEPEPVKKEPIRHARFYGTPGIMPMGYRCGDIEIKRKRGETSEELRARCRDSVEWLDADTLHIFIPIR